MSKFMDLTGQTYGMLTVLAKAITPPSKGVRWECLCQCGEKAEVAANHLRSGATTSCGCFRVAVKTTHGKRGSSTYTAWGNMIARCTNPNSPSYPDYGGRGLKVQDSWLIFENFYADMGDKPKGLTLEREDNERGYFKDNCKWATTAEQALNKRVRADNSSGTRGVYFNAPRNKWTVQLHREGKSKHIGDFLTLEEAVIARNNSEQLWKNSTNL